MKSVLLMFALIGLLSSDDITKREGETVVLHVKANQTLQNYLWTYGPRSPIRALAMVTNRILTVVNGTRFGPRLQLNINSGSMTISNLTINDSGKFLMQIFTETGTEEEHFTLTVTGNSNFVEALEGANVMLTSRVKQLDLVHNTVVWTVNDFSGKQIVSWQNNKITYDSDWRERLLLDPQNGSLTLINVRKRDSDVYCIRMMYDSDPHHLIKYPVQVYSEVSTLNLSTKEQTLGRPWRRDWSCSVNCSVQNSDDLVLSWHKGDEELNKTSDSDEASTLVLTLDVPLNSNQDNFTCVAANPVSSRSVVFDTSHSCKQPAEDFLWIIAIVGGIIVCLILVIVAVFCKTKSQRQRSGGSSLIFESDTI